MSNEGSDALNSPNKARREVEAAIAEYIADLLKQLQKLAATSGHVRLAYLIGASVEEAEAIPA